MNDEQLESAKAARDAAIADATTKYDAARVVFNDAFEVYNAAEDEFNEAWNAAEDALDAVKEVLEEDTAATKRADASEVYEAAWAAVKAAARSAAARSAAKATLDTSGCDNWGNNE